jgi:hypothetical protein
MAEINVQRRTTGAWIWLLAIIGAIVLLWALVRGFDREPDVLPGTPGVWLLIEPQDFATADVMSPRWRRTGHDVVPSHT